LNFLISIIHLHISQGEFVQMNSFTVVAVVVC